MSFSRIMSQGRQALSAGQLGLTTTSKNIANVNTPGYSRQRIEMVSGNPQDVGKLRIGGGVDVVAVTRSTNEFVNKRLETENSDLGKFEGMADVFRQIENIFADESETGIMPGMNQFFNDLRALSTQPDAMPLRSAVRESAEGVVRRFHAVNENLGQTGLDLDRRIEASVTDINSLTDRIAKLNQEIITIEAQGPSMVANDERDKRDLAVQQLSKIIDVQVSNTENGAIQVSSGRVGPLVSGVDAVQLTAARSPDGVTEGSVRIYSVNPFAPAQPKDVTDGIESGSLGGFLHVRDRVIPDIRNKMDQLAFGFADEVNAVHRSAFGRDGQTGINFFSGTAQVDGASRLLRVGDDIQKDVGAIGAGFSPNAPGDNRGILALTEIEGRAILDGGKSTVTDYISTVTGGVGMQMRAANENLDLQRGVVDQLTTFQQQTAGVSLDEEAMNMLQFQKAFDAGAKMIQVADNLMDTVLNLKRF
jgi:flagellar hook-associated protein 1 FlgK